MDKKQGDIVYENKRILDFSVYGVSVSMPKIC